MRPLPLMHYILSHLRRRHLLNLAVESTFEYELSIVSPQAKGRLIDIGCGLKPYKYLFSPFISEYIGVDHHDTPHPTSEIDNFGTAYDLPFKDCSFDTALCTFVIEHLEEPEKALLECSRVLKSGGIAFYSVPFILHLHEQPRDFFRYSKYGAEYLFQKAGFEIVSIKALSGFWVTFGQMFAYNAYRMHRGILRFTYIIPLFIVLIQILCLVLEHFDKTEQWTWAYLVVARKK